MPLEITHAKALYQSLPNIFFIGLMLLLTFMISPGFLFLLLAGELSVLMLAQTKPVKNLMEERLKRERRKDQERSEDQILAGLGETYRKDFQAIRQLCREIEHRAGEVQDDKTSTPLVEGVVDKLSSFRLEYIKMLRAHCLLSTRNYRQLREWLDQESKRVEKSLEFEPSEQVRATMEQNLKVLHQHSAKVRQLDELVRVIEARLQVVRNSLQLIQDEVYSMTDVRGINGVVDELLVNLEINDEFRTYYDDMLANEGNVLAGVDSIEQIGLESHFTPRPPAIKANEASRQ